MGFDIDQLKTPDGDYDEEALGEYQNQLVDLFRESPEGLALRKTHDDAGYWVGLLVDFSYSYIGVSLSEMSVHDMEEVLTELFPRKVTIPPEEAREVVPELAAFWNYLKREYRMEQVDSILALLRKTEPGFPGIMNDPSRFGMAKSMMTMGMESGFDVMSEEGLADFMQHYNAQIANTPMEPQGVKNMLPPIGRKKAVVPPPAGTRNQRKRMRRRNRR